MSAPFDGERRLISAITASCGVSAEGPAEPARRRQPAGLLDQRVERALVGRRHLAVAGDDAVEVRDQLQPLADDRREDRELGAAAGEVAQAGAELLEGVAGAVGDERGLFVYSS